MSNVQNLSLIYFVHLVIYKGFPGKNTPANAGDGRDVGSPLGLEDPLEKEKATHSSVLAWRRPWTEEPDRLQSIGSQRVGYN